MFPSNYTDKKYKSTSTGDVLVGKSLGLVNGWTCHKNGLRDKRLDDINDLFIFHHFFPLGQMQKLLHFFGG